MQIVKRDSIRLTIFPMPFVAVAIVVVVVVIVLRFGSEASYPQESIAANPTIWIGMVMNKQERLNGLEHSLCVLFGLHLCVCVCVC